MYMDVLFSFFLLQPRHGKTNRKQEEKLLITNIITEIKHVLYTDERQKATKETCRLALNWQNVAHKGQKFAHVPPLPLLYNKYKLKESKIKWNNIKGYQRIQADVLFWVFSLVLKKYIYLPLQSELF